ncbi:16S rRNA (cytidine(1402)-2'-O)-methyltransferase [uncultured Slackia sp.]|uniref:16S rRNA (cytidine(1402)-2'-O)-methyltransferase n=1 Tax=uncultured Slackia sp. TaxID=665903 RepID=UPI0026DF682B|nr:16S rRNA (cytidine(1402)-2'-O)-methyltransferase [uncultured Slackia sp.]
MAGRLVICPTPIGNLGDMTLRTLEELRDADAVCAEDTRVTGKLLAHFGIEKRLERLDEAAITHQAGRVAERVAAGETVAFCSDAGMPGVSDPGARLIEAVRAAGGHVDVLPGASAAVTAYVASGFNNPRFFFGGFFPRKDAERRELLRALSSLDAVLMFYESPRRIVSALSAVAEAMPKREVAVCRELTKVHEEVARGPVSEVLAEFARRDEDSGVKGEIVLVIGPSTQAEEDDRRADAAASAAGRAAELVEAGELTRKEIVKVLRDEFGIPRNEAYDLAMKA